MHSSILAIGHDTQDLLRSELSSQDTVLAQLADRNAPGPAGTTSDSGHKARSTSARGTDLDASADPETQAGTDGARASPRQLTAALADPETQVGTDGARASLRRLTTTPDGDLPEHQSSVHNVAGEPEDMIIPDGATFQESDSLYKNPTPLPDDGRKDKGKGRAVSREVTMLPRLHTASAEPSRQLLERVTASMDEASGSPLLDTRQDAHLLSPSRDKLGATVLAALAWEKAVSYHWPIAERMDEKKWRATAVPLMCSIPVELTKELFGRNLASAILNSSNEQITELYAPESPWREHYAARAPSIYVRNFCDKKTGRSLTPNEMFKILHRLALYATEQLTDVEADLVLAVEESAAHANAKIRYVKQGRRHFFSGKFADPDASNRQRQLNTFCDGALRWLNEIELEARDTPLGFTLSYIGYALVFSKRIIAHNSESSHSSSWLMNLFLATARVVLDGGAEEWGFESHVVCYCASADEVSVAEALLTALTSAWYHSGTGFGIHAPGENVFSADFRNLTHEEANNVWKVCQNFREDHTPYLANIDLEFQKIKEYPENWRRLLADKRDHIPDFHEEARETTRRVAAKKDQIRRELETQLGQIKQQLKQLHSLMPESTLVASYSERLRDVGEECVNLGKARREQPDIQEGRRRSEAEEGSMLPDADQVFPSTEMDRMPVAGPSRPTH